MLNPNTRYKLDRFLSHLRKHSPNAYIQYMVDTNQTCVLMIDYEYTNKLHKEIRIRDGKVFVWIYSKLGKLIYKDELKKDGRSWI